MREKDVFFFFNDTATTEIYTLSLHDALPISGPTIDRPRAAATSATSAGTTPMMSAAWLTLVRAMPRFCSRMTPRSEEHTSELQSRQYLVCRLLLEKKNTNSFRTRRYIYHSNF